MTALKKFNQKKGYGGFHYKTLIRLLAQIHLEIDPKIKNLNDFISFGGRGNNYYLNPTLNSKYLEPMERGSLESDLTRENCPAIALGTALRHALTNNRNPANQMRLARF